MPNKDSLRNPCWLAAWLAFGWVGQHKYYTKKDREKKTAEIKTAKMKTARIKTLGKDSGNK